MGDVVLEREGPGGGGGVVVALDIVFQQDGNAVKRPANLSGLPLGVELARVGEGMWVQGYDRVDIRAR